MARSDKDEKRNAKRDASEKDDKAQLAGEGAYEVGYGKPPKHRRWVKGQSGNPYGRPRKSDKRPFAEKPRPIRDLYLEELERTVEVKEGGVVIEMEAIRAVQRKLIFDAIKGDRNKASLVLKYATAAEASRLADVTTLISNVETYKARWGDIFQRSARCGDPEPSQLPHPDHVNIDPDTGALVFSGPQTPEEKRGWDFLKFQCREAEKLVEKFRIEAWANPNCAIAAERVAFAKENLRNLEKKVPPGWDWRETLGWEQEYEKRLLEKLNRPRPAVLD